MSNQPPIGVPQGAIRLNTDSQKLEFYAQDQWYEMATDFPNLETVVLVVYYGGGVRANILIPGQILNILLFQYQGNTIDFGDQIYQDTKIKV